MTKVKSLLFENLSLRQTVWRNGVWRAISLGFGKAIRLVVILLAARWLGPNEFGIYSYALSIASLVFIFSDWGINLLFTRDAQHEEPQKVFSVALYAKLLISTLSLLVACVTPFVMSGIMTSVFIFIAVTLFLTNIRELYTSAMIATQRAELEGYVSFIEGLANIALLFSLLYGIRTADGFAIFNLLLTIIALVLSVLFVKKYLQIKVSKTNSAAVMELLKSGLPLALFGIAGYLFFSADQLFIEYFFGTESVGYYALATRAIYAAMILPSLAVSVLFPVISKFSKEIEKLKYIFYRGTALLTIGGTIFALVIFILKDLLLFFAPQYTPSLPIIAALAWILCFMFPSLLLDNILIALNKQKQDFFLTLGAALLNILLNMIWIPHYGVLGAVYASLISQAVNTLITFFYAQYVLKKMNN